MSVTIVASTKMISWEALSQSLLILCKPTLRSSRVLKIITQRCYRRSQRMDRQDFKIRVIVLNFRAHLVTRAVSGVLALTNFVGSKESTSHRNLSNLILKRLMM